MAFYFIKNKFLIYLFLIFPLLLSGQKELKNIDIKLDALFGHYNIGEKPGVSIAILENNKPTIFKSYGNANLEYQIKNTPNTLFNAADLAKQFTVFSIMILQDQGKLSIHDNVKKHLSELKEWPFELTLKHLMEQTSGLKDVMELKKWIGYQNGDIITQRDILEFVAKQQHLSFQPGSKFEYNRTGFVLLTEVIAKASGMSFSHFVRQHIFNPLGMSHSVFVDTHTELIKNRSYSYVSNNNKFEKIVNNSSFVGGTNLYTSASDFAKWLQNMTTHRLGKPAFFEYMHTNIELSDGQISNYTPGIFKENSQGYWTIHLEGFDHGYTSYMKHVPEHNYSLVFFSNDIDFPLDDVYDSIFNWFNTGYSIPPVTALTAPSVNFIDKPTTELQNYTGSYLFEDNFSFRSIALENDTLFYVRSKNNRTPIVPIEGTHLFKMIFPGEDNLRVTFKNQGDIMEFRSINPTGGKDYVTLGRKVMTQKNQHNPFSGKFRNDLLNHTIMIQHLDKGMQVTIDEMPIVLTQIGHNEFLPQQNSKVEYLRLQRDNQGKVIGVFLSGGPIRSLHYKLIKNHSQK